MEIDEHDGFSDALVAFVPDMVMRSTLEAFRETTGRDVIRGTDRLQDLGIGDHGLDLEDVTDRIVDECGIKIPLFPKETRIVNTVADLVLVLTDYYDAMQTNPRSSNSDWPNES